MIKFVDDGKIVKQLHIAYTNLQAIHSSDGVFFWSKSEVKTNINMKIKCIKDGLLCEHLDTLVMYTFFSSSVSDYPLRNCEVFFITSICFDCRSTNKKAKCQKETKFFEIIYSIELNVGWLVECERLRNKINKNYNEFAIDSSFVLKTCPTKECRQLKVTIKRAKFNLTKPLSFVK